MHFSLQYSHTCSGAIAASGLLSGWAAQGTACRRLQTHYHAIRTSFWSTASHAGTTVTSHSPPFTWMSLAFWPRMSARYDCSAAVVFGKGVVPGYAAMRSLLALSLRAVSAPSRRTSGSDSPVRWCCPRPPCCPRHDGVPTGPPLRPAACFFLLFLRPPPREVLFLECCKIWSAIAIALE